MKLFDIHNDIPIVLQENADEAIVLAARDLQSNLRVLSKKGCGFEITTKICTRGIFINTEHVQKNEAYTVVIEAEAVRITGSDVLGTVFGIYGFATKYLNILPFYKIADIFPDPIDFLDIEEQIFHSQEHTVRFRGWFINDEDLFDEAGRNF